MKKYLILLCLVSVYSAGPASAQLRVGVIGGVTYGGINQYTNQSFAGTSSGTTWHLEFFTYNFNAGLQFDCKLGKSLHFHPNLLYTRKAWKDHSITGDNASDVIEYNENSINYIEAPLNIMYGTKLGPGKVYVGIGPYIAYALKGEFKTRSSDPFIDPNWMIAKAVFNREGQYLSMDSATVGINRWDYGINGLIGYEFNFGLSFDLRYEAAFPTLYYHDREILGPTKFSTFSLNVGYLLTFHAQ